MPDTLPADKPRCYSYIRFSSGKQALGDSARRQIALAERWAEANGMEIDRSVDWTDSGVSAFKGRHVREDGGGKLGEFIALVRQGSIPEGSYLLIEGLDRFSRFEPIEAIGLLNQITKMGINVVTLTDGRVWTAETLSRDYMAMVMALLTLIRANEESVTKGRRVAAAWANKKRRAAEGGPLITAKAPAWLRMKADRSGFELVPEKAAIVLRIYQMFASGHTPNAIARALNREQVPPFERAEAWNRNYIHSILRSHAPLGTLKLRGMDGTIEGYFPAAIPADLWHTTCALIDTTTTVRPRKGQARSIVAGLARCHLCGGLLVRNAKDASPRRTAYLICHRARTGAGCIYRSIRYQEVEGALIARRQEIAERCPRGGNEGEAIAKALEALEAERDDLADQAERLLDALALGRPEATRGTPIQRRLDAIEARMDAIRAEQEQLEQRRGALGIGMVEGRLGELVAALEALEGNRCPETVGRANAALRALLVSAIVDWERGSIELHWKHGGFTEMQYGWIDDLRVTESLTKSIP